MRIILASNTHQPRYLFAVVTLVGRMPQLDQPHHISHQSAERGDSAKCRQAHSGEQSVETA